MIMIKIIVSGRDVGCCVSNIVLRNGKVVPSRLPRSSLQARRYLDLSNLGIGILDRLDVCPNLETLNLSDNSLLDVDNIITCTNLWKIDLSNNKISTLYGISRYYAIGTLVLCNNVLSWVALSKIRHVIILNLYLAGNPALSNDPYYRIHVIDTLPNLWALDGKIITAAERKQCEHFFHKTAASNRPVRHKSSEPWSAVRPGSDDLKDRLWGQQTKALFKQFTDKADHNINLDIKRLQYLTSDLQNELIIEDSVKPRDKQVALLTSHPTFIEDLMKARSTHLDQCNMILVLLVASLEFTLPTRLVKATLAAASLNKFTIVDTMEIFLLPRDIRSQIASLLLSAAKIDQDLYLEDGLYDHLYISMFHILGDISLARFSSLRDCPPSVPNYTQREMLDRSLLAAEIVQLFSVVPVFFEIMHQDIGVMNLLIVATQDASITDKIKSMTNEVTESMNSQIEITDVVSRFLQDLIHMQVTNLFSRRISLADHILCTPTTSNVNVASPMLFAKYHAYGKTSPNIRPTLVVRPKHKHFPHLGDTLLISPLTVATVVSLPEPFLALVKINEIPGPNGGMVCNVNNADAHYKYIDISQMDWCEELSQWVPKDTSGDRITLSSTKGQSDTKQEQFDPAGHLLTSRTKTFQKLMTPQTSLVIQPALITEVPKTVTPVMDKSPKSSNNTSAMLKTDTKPMDDNGCGENKMEKVKTDMEKVCESKDVKSIENDNDLANSSKEEDVVDYKESEEGADATESEEGADATDSDDVRRVEDTVAESESKNEARHDVMIEMLPTDEMKEGHDGESEKHDEHQMLANDASNVEKKTSPTSKAFVSGAPLANEGYSSEDDEGMIDKMLSGMLSDITIKYSSELHDARVHDSSGVFTNNEQLGLDINESTEGAPATDVPSHSTTYVTQILRRLSPEPPPTSPEHGQSPRVLPEKKIVINDTPTEQQGACPKTREHSSQYCWEPVPILDNYSRLPTLEPLSPRMLGTKPSHGESPVQRQHDRNMCPVSSTAKRYGANQVMRQKGLSDGFPARTKLPNIRYHQRAHDYRDQFKEIGIFQMIVKAPSPIPGYPAPQPVPVTPLRRNKLHVKGGSRWLASGRDLFTEMMNSRPATVHVPSWRDGLMNRKLWPTTPSTTVLPNIMVFSKDKKTKEFVYNKILRKPYKASKEESSMECIKLPPTDDRDSVRPPNGIQVWNQTRRRVENMCIPCLQKVVLMAVD